MGPGRAQIWPGSENSAYLKNRARAYGGASISSLEGVPNRRRGVMGRRDKLGGEDQ